MRSADQGATYSFTHDIFFEWAYYRLLIGRGVDWTAALVSAGEPPLLGRVVSLFAESAIASGRAWEDGFAALSSTALRPQWRRAWLIGPPARTDFASFKDRFEALLIQDDHALLRRFLVWFQAENHAKSAGPAEPEYHPGWGHPPARGRPSQLALRLPNLATRPLLAHVHSGQPAGLAAAARTRAVSGLRTAPCDIPNQVSEAILGQCTAWLETSVPSSIARNCPSTTVVGRTWQRSSLSLRSDVAADHLRSACGYPAHGERLLDRTIANRHLRDKTYSQVVVFSAVLSSLAPQKLADLARAELIESRPIRRSNVSAKSGSVAARCSTHPRQAGGRTHREGRARAQPHQLVLHWK